MRASDIPAVVPLHVVAGAIINNLGEVLIARRHDHVHQGGLWEFPGGKVEPDESAEQALARELREELGIAVRKARPLIRIRHVYPTQAVDLDVWRVEAYSGAAHGREGQPLAWRDPHTLRGEEFPAANRPIITALRLPERYLITPEPGADRAGFLSALQASLHTGVRLVQLRAKSLGPEEYRVLAQAVLPVCRAHGARLLLNADPEWVVELGADGVHLSAARLRALRARPLSHDYWVAASAHDAAELEQARRIGVDFAVLGPVLATASHPDATPLGWPGFAALAHAAALPVYALGGLTPAHLASAFQHGAQGVAAIRGLWAGQGRV